MFKNLRKLGYGALVGGAVTSVGCTTLGLPFGGSCGSCGQSCAAPQCDNHCGPACGQSCGNGCTQCGGIRGKLYGCFHRRSNAVPDTFPLGKVSEAWYYEMETNAEAVDFVIHDLDFVGQTTELTSDGKDHVMEIAARMRSAPFPVIVERFPNNADPELDQARRGLVAQILTDFGNPDAQQRTVVSTSYGPGYTSMQAQRNYFRYNLFGNNSNNGNNGNSAGGFGGGGGGGIGGGGF